MRREFGSGTVNGNGHTNGENGHSTNGTSTKVQELDVLIAGSGFSGCKLLYQLRKLGFNVKIAEAGTDLGGIWHWNTYPGARVDSPYPVYSLSLPEVYETWTWSEQYPVRNSFTL
jgi:cation diffusion facilitator CzcD-associated flavoprotein CzcO